MVPSGQWFHLIWEFSTSSRLLSLWFSAAVFGFCLFVFRCREGFDDADAGGGDVEAAYSESLARLVMQPVMSR